MKYPSKIRDEKHKAFIRSLPCAKFKPGICKGRVEAAHLRLGSNAGMGTKPDDNLCVPLCSKCHREQHQIGEKAFWGYLSPVRVLAERLYRINDKQKATAEVLKYAAIHH